MTRVWIPCVVGAAMLAVSCNSSSSGGTGPTTNLVTNGTFSATIDGAAWSPFGQVVVRRVTNNTLGMTAISSTYGMTVALNGISGPGTFNVGANGLQGSQILVVKGSSGSWVSNNPGGTGSMTFTTFTSSHVTGTFSFDAPPISGSGAALHVVNGVFDLTY